MPVGLQDLLIAGVGNVLLGDEGLGVHVARFLLSAGSRLPPGVEVLEAGTALMDLLGEMGRFRRLIVVDAIQAGGAPGSIYSVELGGEIGRRRRGATQLSLHEDDLLDTLATAKVLGLLPKQVTLIGAEPERIEFQTELSPRLRRAAERISEALMAAARRGGGIDLASQSCAKC